ncbi:hypothetical protein [Xanthobacter aminoxidans]|uniref:hypothetical protein n=1 Tax=Xanthobacter aminoxidans TaxID=186280 RepID=UPI002022E31A|nr:hypothetical protein [Xanthobacter aminoxidans]MCL8382482.1 hypothetical protein [Xanthobacter aminoxidans]
MSFFSSRQPAPVPVLPEVMQALAESDMARDAMAARAATITAHRVEVAAALAAEEKASRETFLNNQKAREESATAIRAAEKALQDARNHMVVDFRRGLIASQAHTMAMANLQAELRATASPAVAEFIGWLLDEEEKLRRFQPFTEIESKRHPLTGQVSTRVVASDADAADARRMALRAARPQAEALFLVADQSGIPAAIARIKSALPEIKVAVPPAQPDAAQRAETNITNLKDLKNGH